MKNKNLYFTAALLFLFFMSLRIPGIFSLSVQPDEYHWRERSLEILNQIHERNFTNVTTHLGQPGVPPALLMAFGEWFASKIGLIGRSVGEYSIDYLHAARFVCIFVSSVVVFPIVILGSRLFGFWCAVFGAILLGLNPHHIGLSRLAHLDTIMSVFVVWSVLYYLLAQKENKLRYKLYSGFFWGLAVATKPTAATLIFGFILYNLYLFFRKKINTKNVVSASDFFAVLVGHLVFATLYTRLWVHKSEYLIRLKIECSFADQIFIIASHNHYLWPVLLVVSLVITILSIRKRGEQVFNSYFVFVAWLTLFVLAFPSIVENLSRFWLWSFGLSHEVHKAYGVMKNPPPYGYFGILVRDLTPITLIGIVASIFFGVFIAFKKNRIGRDEIFGLISISTIWVVVLSVSSKQTIRYLVPILCLMFLVLSYFYISLVKFGLKHIPANYHLIFKSLFFILATLPSFILGFQLSPYQMVYENSILCFFNSKFELDKQRYLVGVNEVSKFIRTNVGLEKKVFVLGDIDVLRLTQMIVAPDITRVKYLPPSRMNWGYLLVRFHQYDQAYQGYVENNFKNLEPLFTSYLEKEPIISVYRMPMPGPNDDRVLRLADFFKGQGVLFRKNAVKLVPEISRCPDGVECLALLRDRAKRGIFLFGTSPFFDEATYKFSISTEVINSQLEHNLLQPILRLKVGSCTKDFTLKDFPDSKFGELTMECSFDSLAPRNVTAFWFGTQDIIVSDIKLRRLPSN